MAVSIQHAKSSQGSLAENLKKVTMSPEKISGFCHRNSIQRLSLFGSILRDDFNDQSDVDFLVEFAVGATPGYFGLVAMEDELTEMTGRKADLRTPEELSRYFRHEVLEEAVVQFAQK